VVAIDGPAGAGKSTVAWQVAERLGFVRVDTGALYRAVGLIALERGVSLEDGPALGKLSSELDLAFVEGPSGPRLTVNGADREDDLRTPDVADAASKVSALPEVRSALLEAQRQMGADGGVVLEGRDIGTVVFPDAEVKVFLTASAEARARRRLRDLEERGVHSTYEDVLAAMQARDTRDSSREHAPLKPAEDATVVDSTTMSQDAVVAHIAALADEH